MNNLLLFGRISLFVIYFWFGILKVLGLSPAEPLVHNLFDQILGTWMDFETFNRAFGVIECLIGIAWLIPQWTKIALAVLLAHMGATFLPVFFLPNDTWQNWFTPTLVGQYIIKNLALISLGLLIFQLELEKIKSNKFDLA
ncbi:DUF417 family protein [Algoriphagus mannitolivorans]|uniref:DUF417 family protein n=1 Tax=Algoriphagus mannitolivorans TaxID=226504 RepID=UPI000420AEAF|nr:DUF417 family protein [Algoriphagus mannitolivorans]